MIQAFLCQWSFSRKILFFRTLYYRVLCIYIHIYSNQIITLKMQFGSFPFRQSNTNLSFMLTSCDQRTVLTLVIWKQQQRNVLNRHCLPTDGFLFCIHRYLSWAESKLIQPFARFAELQDPRKEDKKNKSCKITRSVKPGMFFVLIFLFTFSF